MKFDPFLVSRVKFLYCNLLFHIVFCFNSCVWSAIFRSSILFNFQVVTTIVLSVITWLVVIFPIWAHTQVARDPQTGWFASQENSREDEVAYNMYKLRAH